MAAAREYQPAGTTVVVGQVRWRCPSIKTVCESYYLAGCAYIHLAAQSASSAEAKKANELQRLTALGLPELRGPVPVFTPKARSRRRFAFESL
jgi:hypothetical protein